jgi:hypothetical protein
MKRPWISKCVVLFGLLLAPLCAMSAPVNRTWVSAVGDDANPCSRTSPCKTFAGASTKTNPGGEIDVLDPGGFGPVIIDKSLTIDGGGSFAGIVATGVNASGITVNAGADDVVFLRHLSLSSTVFQDHFAANGIKVVRARAVHVIDCMIRDYAHHGIDFEPTGKTTLFVSNSIIMNNGSDPTDAGILAKGTSLESALAIIDHVRVSGNRNGIIARDGSRVSISDSVISGNAVIGLMAAPDAAALAEMNVERSVVTLNKLGIQAGTCAATGRGIVRISNVSVTNNASEGLNHTVGTPANGCGNGEIISARNNTVLGNHPDGDPTAAPGQK